MHDGTSDREASDQEAVDREADRPVTPVDPDAREGYRLVGRLVVDEAGAAEYTVWPEDVPDDELTTAWITARDGAFVALDAMR